MSETGSSGAGMWARWLGAVLFVGTGVVYLVSGLLAPYWAVGAFWVVWVGFLGVFIRSWRRSA